MKATVIERLMLICITVLFVSLLGTIIISMFNVPGLILNIGMLLTVISFLGICLIFSIARLLSMSKVISKCVVLIGSMTFGIYVINEFFTGITKK